MTNFTPEVADPSPPPAAEEVRDVVVVGGGFAGLACARRLGAGSLSVMVVDRRNHHLFQPLLYQVATAALSPADVAEPIRRILWRHANVEVRLAEVEGVDTAARRVRFADGSGVGYRRLVLAPGSSYDYFGRDAWAELAPGLKTIDDARAIRSRVLLNFERAEAIADPAEQARLMTIVVVGGGPTGVEMAGALAELTRWTLARDFRRIDPARARIVLVEAGPRLLGAFPEHLGAYAARRLAGLGVTVVTGRRVEDVRADGIVVGGERIPAGAIVWGAGTKANPAAAWIGVEPADRAGRVAVNPDFSVPAHPDIHVLGDAALMSENGRPLPALAQVARQQGEWLGEHLLGRAPPAFRYRDRGNTAVIGRNAAVFDFGRRQLTGRTAWILWALIHVYLLVGFEKRLLVGVQWLWRYVTYQRGARLIR